MILFRLNVTCFAIMLPTFVLYGFEVHWQTICCEKFTVEETGYFTWPMFGEDDTSIKSTSMFKTHAES